jgi:glycosyl transferase, family 25
MEGERRDGTATGWHTAPRDVPPCFVISLAAVPERLAFAAEGFAAIGLEFEAIEAVDGADLTTAERRRYSQLRSLFHVGHGLTAGAFACSLSHLEFYRRMVDEQLPMAVIFEDDVQPLPAFMSVLAELDRVPPDWDVVSLDPLFSSAATIVERARLRDGEHFVCTYRRNPFGTGCYVLSLAAAERLLAVGEPVCMPPDDLIFRRRPAGLRVYGIEPSVVRHGNFRSELAAREAAAGSAVEPRWWEQPVVVAGKAVHKLRARQVA